ncbi:MAG: patatin-like phospholipase family protein [Fimbriimonadaceae bacterium]|nr:patatin-like phospholipase family protein [Chitinophagales bacterium]
MKKTSSKNRSDKATIKDFTDAVENISQQVKKDKKIVSDIVDSNGNQYVDLVQEGGGMLGIALLGYTYILEQAGIRFRRLAGTSAGAINTALLTVIGKSKSDEKSIISLKYLTDKELFDFVDGYWFAKRFIGAFIKRKDFFKKVISWAKRIFIILGVLILLNVAAVWFIHEPDGIRINKILSVITISYILIVAAIVFYIVYLIHRFKRSQYGINPGNNFLNWIKGIMEENGVHSIDDLIHKASELPPDLQLCEERKKKNDATLDGLTSDVTFIASEIISENKVEFPRMWNLFQTDKTKIHPAEFVRASMSIPVFFEPHTIAGYTSVRSNLKKQWEDELGAEKAPDKILFVDGGILSNFPISIFYNKNVDIPRLPTIGVRLYEKDPKKEAKEKATEQNTEDNDLQKPLNFGSYARNIFNTTRFHYDKDFLMKNKMYNRGVHHINVYGFNWLNFNMGKEDRIALFVKGAEAARDFLFDFNWEAYKQDREQGHKILENK